MKIDLNSPTVSLTAAGQASKKVSSSSLSGAQSTTEDRTTLHSEKLSVQSLTSQALQTPEIRQDKVDALSESVESGQYKPDATATASAILASGGQ